MLRLEHVSVAYGKHEALHDVSIDIPAARTTVILGANGAGKTTLLKTIAGLVQPKPGSRILFEDRPIQNRTGHLALHQPRQRRLERDQIDRHDRAAAVSGEPFDETVTDFAGRTGNQNDRFSQLTS